jgi:hypothetical protein
LEGFEKTLRFMSDQEIQDEGEIRCICGIDDDDGFTIQCEKCFVWQHAICVDISSDNVPELYFCDSCEPRALNVEVSENIYFRKRYKLKQKD